MHYNIHGSDKFNTVLGTKMCILSVYNYTYSLYQEWAPYGSRLIYN